MPLYEQNHSIINEIKNYEGWMDSSHTCNMMAQALLSEDTDTEKCLCGILAPLEMVNVCSRRGCKSVSRYVSYEFCMKEFEDLFLLVIILKTDPDKLKLED